MTSCTYLMPIRRTVFDTAAATQLRAYFDLVQPSVAQIVIVDGSPPDIFAQHQQIWAGTARHEPVDRSFGFLNDKVNGIHTGVRLAETAEIILADDDIRYTNREIEEIAAVLKRFDVVRPQNYLGPAAGSNHDPRGPGYTLPWWAKMEAARMLINRATLLAADYPGTCAFRREAMLRAGPYDGDVLFDNEEIIRHFARSGARICYANDLFVRKCPAGFQKWIEQRPRQAFEDFGLRAKTILFAAIIPCILFLGILAGSKAMFAFLFLIALLSTLLAAVGRAQGEARQFFPAHLCLFAPLWILERSLSTYWAFYWYLRKGGYPFGDRLLRKGIGFDWTEGGRIASQIVASSRSAE
ncbi:MAG: hypothetical protein QOH39_1253 [Verrucomicrobiota bacterium]